MLDLATLGISISTAGILRAQDALRNLSGAAGAAANAALGLTGATGRADDAAARAARALGNLGSQGTGAAAGVNRLGQAAGNAQGRMDAMGRSATGSGAAMRGAGGAADTLRNAMGGLLAAFGVGQLVQLTDQFTKFTAQLRLASTGASDYANALASVQQISTQSQQSIGAVGVLYAKVANGTRELGLSQQQLADIVGTVGLSLSVSGATASESSSAMLQLSQAFASGVLRGEEFNAVNEAAPRLMKALAEGMGVPIGALKKMAEEGKITSEVMAIALPKALREVTEEAKEVATIAGAFTVLNNQILQFVGASANSSGSIRGITTVIVALAENLNVVAVAAATLVGVKLANWATAGIASIVSMTAANGALLASNLAAAQAQVTATATSAVLTAARLAEVRAAVLASTGTVQLALVTNGLIPAQAAAAAAAAAHSAALGTLAAATGAATIGARALNVALMFVGSPLGLITAALGIGASAWLLWGNNAEKGTKQAAGAVAATSEEINANLQKQIEKAQERLDLIKGGNVELARGDSAASQDAAKQLAEINRLKAQGNALSGAERIGLIDKQARFDKLIADGVKLQGIEDKTKSALEGDKAAALMLKLATPIEKMSAELAKYQKELGAAFTPEMEKRIRAQYDTKAKGAGAAAAAVAKEATAYEKLIADIKGRIEANGLEAASGDAVTESQKLRIKLDRDLASGALKLIPIREQEVRLELDRLDASEKVVALEKARAKSQADTLKLIEDTQQADAKTVAAAIEAATTAEEQLRNYGLLKSEVQSLTLAQLENARESAALAGEDVANIQKRIEAQKRLIAATVGIDAREAADKTAKDALESSTKSAKDATAEWQKTADSINSSLTDALMRGFEDGKGFAKNLRDTLTNMFKTMVLRPVISAILAPIAGGLSGAANAAGGGGGALGTASSLSSVLNMNTAGAFGGLFASSAAYGAAIGTSSFAAGSQAAMLAAQTGTFGAAGLSATGAAAGTAAGGFMASAAAAGPYVLAAAAVIALLSKKTPGEQAQGGFFSSSGATGLDAANRITNDAGGGAARDLITRANAELTTQVKDTTTALLKDVTGLATAIGSNVALGLDLGFAANLNGKGADKNAFGYFGVSADGMAGETVQNRQLGEDVSKAYATITTAAADALAKIVLGSSDLGKSGETSMQTLQRLAGSLQAVNSVFDTLGKTALTASLASGDIASKLVDAFGGLENFASATSTYYEAFYSEQERTATGVRQLTETLAELGIALPNTGATDALAQYRALVDAQDINTEAGRASYAALVTLSGGFAQLEASTKSMAQAAADAAAATLKNLTDQNQQLRVADFEARGNTAGAAAALGLSPVESAVFSANAALKRSTEKYLEGVQNQRAKESAIFSIGPGMSLAATQARQSEERDSLTGSGLSADAAAQAADKAVADAAAQAATALERFTNALKNLVSEQADLQVDLLRAQGNATGAAALARTNALGRLTEDMSAENALQITAQFDANQATRDQIKALTDATSAADQLQNAWRGITDSLLSEVDRIRGTLAEGALDSMAAIGARFALATAQARAGDQTAAGNLSGLSGQLLGVAAGEVTSRAALLLMQAQVADSLQTTAGVLGGTVPTLAALPTQPTQNTERLERLVVTLTDKIASLEGRLSDIQANTRRTADVIDGGVVLTEAA